MERDYSKQEVLDIVQQTAIRYGIPKDDFLRASYIETGGQFNERAYNSSSKAAGLYQFLPDTAAQYGISGREYDPAVNADAGARFYLDNQRSIVASHGRSGRPYLSGEVVPNGLDMYMAHQQGSYGYRSIQAAIDTGNFFSDTPTRRNIIANVGDDLNAVTGVTKTQFNAMSDRDVATTFVRYWETKYERIAIPELGIAPRAAVPGNSVQSQSPQTSAVDPLTDGVLKEGEKGTAVRQLQEQLIREKIIVDGKPLVPDGDYGSNTKAAVAAYQSSRGLEDDGVAGKDTLAALRRHAPEVASAIPIQAGAVNANWPAPGNFKINDADKQGEGHGEFGTARSNRSGRHSGLDIQGKVGDPIEAYAPGKVVYADHATGYGNTVVIDHGNGQRTLYAHLDRINVENGQVVSADTKIASMGRSGNTPSTGDTHLHFEIRTGARAGEPFSGKAVDPLPYLNNSRQISTIAGTQNPMSDGVLRQGENGAEVKKLQEQLNALGFKDAQGKTLVPDADFGGKTKQAVEAFQRAHGLVDDGIVGKATFAALKKPETAAVVAPISQPVTAAKVDQSPLLSNPGHPDHALYKQALIGLEKLPANTFRNEQERQNAAASVAFEAKVTGLTKIDNVALSTNGSGLFAVQGAMNDPGHQRVYVDKAQAAAQPIDKSTQQMQQDTQIVQPPQAQEQQKKTVVI
jgi:murein DD-endopeptidase MepM/ murein hydrolase activator NlpD